MYRILVVDDEPYNRDIVKIRLEQSGYQVTEAANGEEGLSMAQTNPPDLIILDVMMPKMDGWQVCRNLKKDEKTKDIPVVMLTARSQEIEEMRSWESGANDYLTKPCDHKRLVDTVGKFLSQKTEA